MVTISICMVVVFVLGCFAGAYLRYLGFKKKINKVRDEQYKELKKIFDLTNSRAKVVTTELGAFVDYVNDVLPKELTNICIAEPAMLILKEKAGIPDKTYLEAMEPIIINTQNLISGRLTATLESINAETVKSIKGLMTDVQEK